MNSGIQPRRETPKSGNTRLHYWIGAILLVSSQGGIILAAIGDAEWQDWLGAALLAPSVFILALPIRAFLKSRGEKS